MHADKVKRPSRPPSRKYEQHGKVAPPTYKSKFLSIHKTRDPSVVRKRPYSIQRPNTAPTFKKVAVPIRRVIPSQDQKTRAPISKSATSKTVAPAAEAATATSKAATPTSKSGTPASKAATPASKAATPASKAATHASKAVTPTSKAESSTSKSGAPNTIPVEKANVQDANTNVEESTKKDGNKTDVFDDLDIKGLREEPASEGHYELNPLMSRVLEKELQTIMIKVWQDLPDKPPTAAEKAVVEKLRTEAGDDLKKVLGLNVSKRLLNIHNPLYVKVTLSGKPDRVSLKEFVKTYNCIGLKYVPSQSTQHYTFVAQFKHFSDFDKICTTKIVRCGNERVSIYPSYKFTTCPPHLKSIYNDNFQHFKDSSAEESQINKDSNENKTAGSSAENTRSVKTVAEKTAGAQNVAKSSNSNENQPQKESDTKKGNAVNDKTKPDSIAKPAVTDEKKLEPQATKNNDNKAKKAEVTPIKVVGKAQPAKVTLTNTVAKAQLQKITPLTAQPAQSTTAKENPKKTTPAKAQLEKNIPAKVPQNATPQKITLTKVTQQPTPQKVTNNTKVASKVVAKKPNIASKTGPNNEPITKTPLKGNSGKKSIEQKDITAKISEMIANDKVYDDVQPAQADDQDILDDEDILALMSGAIVLDECRGSDEE